MLATVLLAVATGGLAVAVSEMAVASAVGARIAAAADPFGEMPSRVVLSVPEAAVPEVEARAAVHGVEVADIGVAGGDRITIEPAGGSTIDVGLADAVQAWRDRLPASLGAGVARAHRAHDHVAGDAVGLGGVDQLEGAAEVDRPLALGATARAGAGGARWDP